MPHLRAWCTRPNDTTPSAHILDLSVAGAQLLNRSTCLTPRAHVHIRILSVYAKLQAMAPLTFSELLPVERRPKSALVFDESLVVNTKCPRSVTVGAIVVFLRNSRKGWLGLAWPNLILPEMISPGSTWPNLVMAVLARPDLTELPELIHLL